MHFKPMYTLPKKLNLSFNFQNFQRRLMQDNPKMVAYTQGQVGQSFIFQGVKRGTNNKFYGRKNYKIRNKEKEEIMKKIWKTLESH